ncbi:MAG: glutamate--tRNA ligase family protein [Candidatus Aminicenantales bacterium]|jgi:glutamyl-tRNA synthetase
MITVRFAPSPTGFLHLGSARTALFNWLVARHSGGRFLLRIEDTDRVRSDVKFLEEILEDLKWLGLDWDGELTFQSDRFDLYRQKAEELLAAGKAYKEGEAVIFKIEPGRTIDVEDMIHGRITFATENFKDQVLIKSDGSPAYNFSCVVDDADLGITHILRGDDHITNTPKQVLFYEALGLTPPRFGHMPLILGPDGAKLSKRHGGVSVAEYKNEGFLPEALANYLILLGWTPPTAAGAPGSARGSTSAAKDRPLTGVEILPLGEAAKIFEIPAMNDVQAKFDIQKLKWMNGEYIMKRTADELLPLLKAQLRRDGFDLASVPDDFLVRLIDLYKVRIKTLREFGGLTDAFLRDDFAIEQDAWKKFIEPPGNRENLREFAARLAPLADFRRDAIEAVCRGLAEERKLKAAEIIHPTRVAISGKTKGAGLFEIMELLGKDKVIQRMRGAAS